MCRPPRACSWIIAASCGPATIAAITAPSATGHSRATAGRHSSQGTRTSPVRMPVRTADSGSVSTAAPTTTPRMRAWRQPGDRRSRTEASRASGRNSAPTAMLTWYQSSWASIADRPKKAPAAIAPVWLGSHSRAARYIA